MISTIIEKPSVASHSIHHVENHHSSIISTWISQL